LIFLITAAQKAVPGILLPNFSNTTNPLNTMNAMNRVNALMAAGLIALMSSCKPTQPEQQTIYQLNDAQSVAEWTGYGQGFEHLGDFRVTSQNLTVVDGTIRSGTFTIPIASIRNFDLPEGVKDQLLNHLKSPDFFNLALHPEASFTITRVTPYTGNEAGAIAGANYQVVGNFSLLGKTNELQFPARITLQQGQLKAEANLKLDRTRWGMLYAADPALGDHHIKPEVAIHLKLEGSGQPAR